MPRTKKPSLPYPRLELRWRKPTKVEVAECDSFPPDWACDYVLVMHKRHSGDQRCNGPKGAYAARDVEFTLNTTMRGGSSEPLIGENVDTPFRDGAHAQWDSQALHVPAFAVYGKYSTPIEIRR